MFLYIKKITKFFSFFVLIVGLGTAPCAHSAQEKKKKERKSFFHRIGMRLVSGVKDGAVTFQKSDGTQGTFGEVMKEGFEKFGEALSKEVIEKGPNAILQKIIELGWNYSGMIVLTTIGFYAAKYGLEHWYRTLTRPNLITEWSYKSTWQKTKDFFKSFVYKNKTDIKPLVFSPHMEKELTALVNTTKKAHQRIRMQRERGKKVTEGYSNILLAGPPGTGKTAFLKRFIQELGCMNYAHIHGASFHKFTEEQGLKEMDDLFNWALKEKSNMRKLVEFFYDWLIDFFDVDKRDGLILFIDEIEALMPKRENLPPTDKAYKFLTSFLDYTGEFTDKFLIVGATNHKAALDSATWRRFHIVVDMPLPDYQQRLDVLKLYRDKMFLDKSEFGPIYIKQALKNLSNKKLAEIAERTDGLSNGELETLIKRIKDNADITQTGFVTEVIVGRVVEQTIRKLASFKEANALAAQ